MRLVLGLLILLSLGIGSSARTAAEERITNEIRCTDTRCATVIPLEYAVVDDLAPVLRKLLDGEDALQLAIASDWRTNSILAVGDPVALGALRALVRRLDVPVFSGHPHAPARIVELKRIDAIETAALFTRLIESSPAMWRCTRRGPTASVAAQPTDNRLLVQGDPEATNLLRELALGLDAAREDAEERAETAPSVVSADVLLEYALVGEIAPVLHTLFPPGHDDAMSLRWARDLRHNRFHVVAPPEEVERFRRVVERLDIPECYPALRYPVRLVALEHVEAAEMADLFTHLIRARPRMWQRLPGDPPPTVVADRTQNHLIVQGDEVAVDHLLERVQELDVAGGKSARPDEDAAAE